MPQEQSLAAVRAEINRCDEAIADAIAERTALAEEVAAVKRRDGTNLVDEDRKAAVKAHYAERFEERGLNPDHGEAIAALLINVALEQEYQAAD